MNPNEPAPIVCGTDFSETASEAAKIAAMIASRLNVPLKLIFSRDPLSISPPPEIAKNLDENYQKRIKEEAHKLEKCGAQVEGVLCHGSPAESLVKVAQDSKARLLIVGWFGVNSRWRIGSTAQRVCEFSPVPTLVIQDPEPFKKWLNKEQALKIFVGTDFSISANKALRWVKELMQIAPCEITATYISQPGEEAQRLGGVSPLLLVGNPPDVQLILERDLREKVDTILGPNDAKILVFGNWASKSRHLAELARREKSHLIVVGTHQRHGENRLRHGSISYDILHESPTSVACVPASTTKATAQQKIRACQRVLVAVDLNEAHGFTSSYAYSIVDRGGKVLLMHNNSPFRSNTTAMFERPDQTEELEKRLLDLEPDEAKERKIVTSFEALAEDNTAEAICQAAERFNADIVCIGSHTRPGLKAKVLGSVAMAVLQKSHRPVLLVWPPNI